MNRIPLPAGHPITMPNGAVYRIREQIAAGGFSLLYTADTEGGTAPIVIKEFFPAQHADRDAKSLCVCPQAGCEAMFARNRARFAQEGTLGGIAAAATCKAIPFRLCGEGYAVMDAFSANMRSLHDLTAMWEHTPPLPYSGSTEDIDPVFPDIPRICYALRVIEQLLCALMEIHALHILHLDLSASNILWGGSDCATGRDCTVFIADYGCAIPLDDATADAEVLSYSPGFAAPELQQSGAMLTDAADTYSVGMLLYFLCVGESALRPYIYNPVRAHAGQPHTIQRAVRLLRIPSTQQAALEAFLLRATGTISERFASAEAMRDAIRALLAAYPAHPCNPVATDAFTLYSLRSMLAGSRETRYSWAHELRDRRDCSAVSLPEELHEPVSAEAFSEDDMLFLARILPTEICRYLQNQLAAHPQITAAQVMSGTYPTQWKADIRTLLHRHGTQRLLIISRGLLDNLSAFQTARHTLFQLLGAEGERLQSCNFSCKVQAHPYIGLALLMTYALLGEAQFAALLPSPTNDAPQMFYPVA